MFSFLRKIGRAVLGIESKAERAVKTVTKYEPLYDTAWWAVEQIAHLAGWKGPEKAAKAAKEYRDRLQAWGLNREAIQTGVLFAEKLSRINKPGK